MSIAAPCYWSRMTRLLDKIRWPETTTSSRSTVSASNLGMTAQDCPSDETKGSASRRVVPLAAQAEWSRSQLRMVGKLDRGVPQQVRIEYRTSTPSKRVSTSLDAAKGDAPDRRQQLPAALCTARLPHCPAAVSELDRLAHDASVHSALMTRGVPVLVAGFGPDVYLFVSHLVAALAEKELAVLARGWRTISGPSECWRSRMDAGESLYRLPGASPSRWDGSCALSRIGRVWRFNTITTTNSA